MSARRKAAALEAPQTIERATHLCARYAAILTGVEQVRADADTAIANIQAERDEFAKPLEEEAKDIFRQLQRWWAVAGDAMTEGKRKSAEIAGCILGVRITPPSLKVQKGKNQLASCQEMLSLPRLQPLVTVKLSYNKPAIIAELKKPVGWMQETLICDFGFSVEQREEFFIDRARAEPLPADPETISEGEPA